MARDTASAARVPTTVTSASMLPVDSAKTVSPSKVVCTGTTALARPSCAMIATRVASDFDKRAFVATAAMVVLVPW